MFHGWKVVATAFLVAMFGWGFGFYGPPVFLHAVQRAHGWPLAVVSGAVTLHFLFGALVVANLPRLYRRLGVPAVTAAKPTAASATLPATLPIELPRARLGKKSGLAAPPVVREEAI